MFEGGSISNRYPLPAEVRDWQLVKKFGWTKQQIDEQPAVWLDWILAIDSEYETAVEKMRKRGSDVR